LGWLGHKADVCNVSKWRGNITGLVFGWQPWRAWHTTLPCEGAALSRPESLLPVSEAQRSTLSIDFVHSLTFNSHATGTDPL
jgi:hypothetical protein